MSITEKIASMGVPIEVAGWKPQRRDDYINGHRNARATASRIAQQVDARLAAAEKLAEALRDVLRQGLNFNTGRNARASLAEWEKLQ